MKLCPNATNFLKTLAPPDHTDKKLWMKEISSLFLGMQLSYEVEIFT